jgi:stage II sporulation protein D
VLESLYRLVAGRGDAPLTESTLLGAGPDQIMVESGEAGEVLQLAPRRFLFRKIKENVYYSPSLSLLPGDRVLMHRSGDRVDLLVLLSHGGNFDRSSPFSRWTVRKTEEELTAEINEHQSLGAIVDLRPKRYGRSGRVVELEVVGAGGSTTLRGLAIRRRLGIRENLFFIDRQMAPDGSVAAWVFTGGGWGHGVGLCQVGAFGMAAAGHDYVEILSHYYPGTEVTSLVGAAGGGW